MWMQDVTDKVLCHNLAPSYYYQRCPEVIPYGFHHHEDRSKVSVSLYNIEWIGPLPSVLLHMHTMAIHGSAELKLHAEESNCRCRCDGVLLCLPHNLTILPWYGLSWATELSQHVWVPSCANCFQHWAVCDIFMPKLLGHYTV